MSFSFSFSLSLFLSFFLSTYAYTGNGEVEYISMHMHNDRQGSASKFVLIVVVVVAVAAGKTGMVLESEKSKGENSWRRARAEIFSGRLNVEAETFPTAGVSSRCRCAHGRARKCVTRRQFVRRGSRIHINTPRDKAATVYLRAHGSSEFTRFTTAAG